MLLSMNLKGEEIRVYVIDCGATEFDFRTYYDRDDFEPIMEEAERLGSVYSLSYFESQINDECLDLGCSFILIH